MLGTGGEKPSRGGRKPNRGGKKSDRNEKDPKKSKQPKDKKDSEPKPWQAALDARRSVVGQQNRQTQLRQSQNISSHEGQNRLVWEENQRQLIDEPRRPPEQRLYPSNLEWGHAVEPRGPQQVHIPPLNQPPRDDPRLQQTNPSYPIFGTTTAPTYAPTNQYLSPQAGYLTTGRGYAPTTQDPGASTGATTSTRHVLAEPERGRPQQQHVPVHMDSADRMAFSNILNEHRRPSSSSSGSSKERRPDKQRKPN